MLVVPLLLLLLLLVLSAAATSDVIRSAKLHHARHMKLKASAPAPTNFLSVVADAPSLTCDPADYGGDATGEKDSTDALQSCMAKLLASASSRKMASGITDLGGVTLDLAGGTFLTSASLVIPPLFGNMHVNGGTLRASPNFPKSDHLFTIGNSSCAPDGQKSCNEFISFTDIMFDANFHAAGGAVVAHVMGTTFTNTFFTGFLGTALQIDGGHEVMVSTSWFAACYWSDGKDCYDSVPDSLAVQINGNDHYLHNVIVFDFAKKGVEVNGAANVLSGVHTWNGGGVGIEVNAQQTRLLGCYLDYNYLSVKGDGGTGLLVVDSFFLDTNVKIEAATLDGAIFKRNTFAGLDGKESIELDGADYSAAKNVVVEDNLGEVTRYTKQTITKELDFGKGDTIVDFSDSLLLPSITHVHYSVLCNEDDEVGTSCQNTWANKPNGNKIAFSREPSDAEDKTKVTVTVSVTQS